MHSHYQDLSPCQFDITLSIFAQSLCEEPWFACRSCPLYRQACQPNKADGSAAATVFVNTGHAGASLGYNIETNNLGIFESVSISHGYTRATVNRTSFTLEVRPPVLTNLCLTLLILSS